MPFFGFMPARLAQQCPLPQMWVEHKPHQGQRPTVVLGNPEPPEWVAEQLPCAKCCLPYMQQFIASSTTSKRHGRRFEMRSYY